MSKSPMPFRRALVTGGSGDIGQAICLHLARAGFQILVHGHRHPDRAQHVVDAICAAGGAAKAICFDITDAEQTHTVLCSHLHTGAIDVVVHNAGVHDDVPMAGMSLMQWQQVIAVNLHGFFHVTAPLLLPMARQRWGRVVAISSVAAVLGNRGQTNYAAAKAGLHGATRSLAREMASRGITANVIAPGFIAGKLAQPEAKPEQIRQIVPAGRSGEPDDVASLAAFLCSDAAGYLNGQVIGVNGGMA